MKPVLQYFKPSEFTYKGEEVYDKMDDDFLLTLDCIRHLAGVPMVINSSWRPDEGSDHYCRGVDVKCTNSNTRFRLIYACVMLGIKRFGIGETFFHIGDRNDLPQEVTWHYYDDYEKKEEE